MFRLLFRIGTSAILNKHIVALLNNDYSDVEDRTPNTLDISETEGHVELEKQYSTDSVDERSIRLVGLHRKNLILTSDSETEETFQDSAHPSASRIIFPSTRNLRVKTVHK